MNTMIKIKNEVYLFEIFLIIILFSSLVQAQETFVFKKTPVRDIIVAEFANIPLEYTLQVKNTQIFTDYYKFFSLLDVLLFPSDSIKFDGMETKDIKLTIYPKLRIPGKYTYTYYIKNSHEVYEDRYTFEIIKAKNAFNIVFQPLNYGDSELKVKIKNNLDIGFDKLIFSSESEFIEGKQEISLKPYEEKELTLKINEKLMQEKAGEKLVVFVLASGENENEKYRFEASILISEYKNIVSKTYENIIFIGKTIGVKKTNLGNAATKVIFEIPLSAFEKLFAKASAEPIEVKKREGKYVYVFESFLQPGESVSIDIKVNYAWLIIPLVIIIILALLVYFTMRQYIVIIKEARKVKTKAGFALRVYLTIKNKTFSPLKDVALLDFIPLSMKYHEYGITIPDKVENNKLYWKIGEILPGEEKNINYICVSKLKYEGRLELPPAKLKYIDVKGHKIIKQSNTATLFIEKESETE
ncbi:MAG: hypothetical protein QW622_01440 [Candidatus Pacearchaeota archaeon]